MKLNFNKIIKAYIIYKYKYFIIKYLINEYNESVTFYI